MSLYEYWEGDHPAGFIGKEVIHHLKVAAGNASNLPVLDQPENWST